jgi:hypothetical protein
MYINRILLLIADNNYFLEILQWIFVSTRVSRFANRGYSACKAFGYDKYLDGPGFTEDLLQPMEYLEIVRCKHTSHLIFWGGGIDRSHSESSPHLRPKKRLLS